MIKYRGIYRVFMPLDNKGNSTVNENDTYLKCKNNTEIYRYNEELLAVMFTSTGYCNNRIKELNDIGVELKILQNGDTEKVYIFKEIDLEKVSQILKPTTRGAKKSPIIKANRKKRELTEEQLKVLRERMNRIRQNKK